MDTIYRLLSCLGEWQAYLYLHGASAPGAMLVERRGWHRVGGSCQILPTPACASLQDEVFAGTGGVAGAVQGARRWCQVVVG